MYALRYLRFVDRLEFARGFFQLGGGSLELRSKVDLFARLRFGQLLSLQQLLLQVHATLWVGEGVRGRGGGLAMNCLSDE